MGGNTVGWNDGRSGKRISLYFSLRLFFFLSLSLFSLSLSLFLPPFPQNISPCPFIKMTNWIKNSRSLVKGLPTFSPLPPYSFLFQAHPFKSSSILSPLILSRSYHEKVSRKEFRYCIIVFSPLSYPTISSSFLPSILLPAFLQLSNRFFPFLSCNLP